VKTLSQRSRRRIVAGALLAFGWAIALAVWLTALPPLEDPEAYDVEHSKRTLRELESIGGKSAVLANEIEEWFTGLWHGRGLAYTLAFLTLAIALGYYHWERIVPPSRDD